MKKKSISPWWLGKVSAGLILISMVFWTQLHPLTKLAQAVVVLGGIIHLSHYVLLRRSNESIDPPKVLVTTGGLFPWIRHPMYLGDAVVMIGLAGISRSILATAILIGGLSCLLVQQRIEDGVLTELFGDVYRSYIERTLF